MRKFVEESLRKFLEESLREFLQDSSKNLLRDSFRNFLRDSDGNFLRDSYRNQLRNSFMDSSRNFLRNPSSISPKDSSRNLSGIPSEIISWILPGLLWIFLPEYPHVLHLRFLQEFIWAFFQGILPGTPAGIILEFLLGLFHDFFSKILLDAFKIFCMDPNIFTLKFLTRFLLEFLLRQYRNLFINIHKKFLKNIYKLFKLYHGFFRSIFTVLLDFSRMLGNSFY